MKMLPEGNVGGRDDERRKYLKRQGPRYERADRAGLGPIVPGGRQTPESVAAIANAGPSA